MFCGTVNTAVVRELAAPIGGVVEQRIPDRSTRTPGGGTVEPQAKLRVAGNGQSRLPNLRPNSSDVVHTALRLVDPAYDEIAETTPMILTITSSSNNEKP